jgi:hypothetical protein
MSDLPSCSLTLSICMPRRRHCSFGPHAPQLSFCSMRSWVSARFAGAKRFSRRLKGSITPCPDAEDLPVNKVLHLPSSMERDPHENTYRLTLSREGSISAAELQGSRGEGEAGVHTLPFRGHSKTLGSPRIRKNHLSEVLL